MLGHSEPAELFVDKHAVNSWRRTSRLLEHVGGSQLRVDAVGAHALRCQLLST